MTTIANLTVVLIILCIALALWLLAGPVGPVVFLMTTLRKTLQGLTNDPKH